MGEDRVDGVVVDEDSVRSVGRSGCGAKILYGDNALEEYLYQWKPEDEMVCIRYATVSRTHNCNLFFQERNGYSKSYISHDMGVRNHVIKTSLIFNGQQRIQPKR